MMCRHDEHAFAEPESDYDRCGCWRVLACLLSVLKSSLVTDALCVVCLPAS